MTNLSSSTKQKIDFVDTLKSNYKRRIKEVENFSRNFSTSSSDFTTKYLSEISELIQYYLDAQKNFTNFYTLWYDSDLMSRQSEAITEAWINNIRTWSSLYAWFLDYGSKNLGIFNHSLIQIMKISEMRQDISENAPTIQRNMLIEAIKEVKEQNDRYVQKQLPKRRTSSHKESQEDQIVVGKVK